MTGNLKDLFVILVISIPIFWIVNRAFTGLLPSDEIRRYRNVWFAVTLILFLSHNYWLHIVLTFIAIQYYQSRESNKVGLYFMLLFAMPPVWEKVSALGMAEYLFDLKPSRFLEIVILLPAFMMIRKQPGSLPFGKTTSDWLMAGFVLLTFLFRLRETTMTDAMRTGLYGMTDIFLPYYVISRYLRDIKQFKAAMSAFVIAALLLSGAAMYEYAKFHLLYAGLGSDLGSSIEMSNMVVRGSALRALVTTGQPIVLGYILMVAMGFYLFIKREIFHTYFRNAFLVIIAGGLFASLSRGPWVGMAILLIIFIGLNVRAIRNLCLLAASGLLAFALALNLPGGDKLINLLPFVGKTDNYNVKYRERLLDNSLTVISRNPWFGKIDYKNTPEMQTMYQGEGIIDVVNTYLGLALENGLLGLGVFAGFFLNVLWGIYKVLRGFRTREVEHYLFGMTRFLDREHAMRDEYYLLGVTLFAVLIAILVTIYSVSSITLIPVVYWAVAGMGVAYTQMLNRIRLDRK